MSKSKAPLSVQERFQMILQYYQISPATLAKQLKYERAEKIYRVMRGEGDPSFEVISDITKKFVEVSAHWLNTGEGEFLRSKKKKVKGHPVKVMRSTEIAIVPFVAAFSRREYVKSCDDVIYLTTLPILEEELYNDSVFRDFEVSDDFNEPLIKSGDVLRCFYKSPEELINDSALINILLIIVSKKGVFVASQVDVNLDQESIKLHFLNSKQTQTIQSNDILEIWRAAEIRRRI